MHGDDFDNGIATWFVKHTPSQGFGSNASGLTAAQIVALGDKVQYLGEEAIAHLSTSAIQGLSVDQIGLFSVGQINAFSVEQKDMFNEAQRAAFASASDRFGVTIVYVPFFDSYQLIVCGFPPSQPGRFLGPEMQNPVTLDDLSTAARPSDAGLIEAMGCALLPEQVFLPPEVFVAVTLDDLSAVARPLYLESMVVCYGPPEALARPEPVFYPSFVENTLIPQLIDAMSVMGSNTASMVSSDPLVSADQELLNVSMSVTTVPKLG